MFVALTVCNLNVLVAATYRFFYKRELEHADIDRRPNQRKPTIVRIREDRSPRQPHPKPISRGSETSPDNVTLVNQDSMQRTTLCNDEGRYSLSILSHHDLQIAQSEGESDCEGYDDDGKASSIVSHAFEDPRSLPRAVLKLPKVSGL